MSKLPTANAGISRRKILIGGACMAAAAMKGSDKSAPSEENC